MVDKLFNNITLQNCSSQKKLAVLTGAVCGLEYLVDEAKNMAGPSCTPHCTIENVLHPLGI